MSGSGSYSRLRYGEEKKQEKQETFPPGVACATVHIRIKGNERKNKRGNGPRFEGKSRAAFETTGSRPWRIHEDRRTMELRRIAWRSFRIHPENEF